MLSTKPKLISFWVGMTGIAAVVCLSFLPSVPVLLSALTQVLKKSLFLRGVHGDTLCHFLGYFGLMLWFSLHFPRQYHARFGALFILLGAGIELAQEWLTTCRACETRDLFANTTGILLAWFLTGPWIASLFRQSALFLRRRLSLSQLS